MKKNYFMLAATTMMFAACAQTDVVNEIAVEETPQAIGFETFANKATRNGEAVTPTATTALATHHDAYKVWAYKNTQNTTLVFNAEEVKASDNSYSVTQYWDKAATNYYFYAAAPAPLATTTTGSGLVFQETSTGTGESKVTTQESAYFTITNLIMLGTNFSPKDQINALGSFIQREQVATTEGGTTSSTPAQTTSEHDIDYMIASTPVTKETAGSFTNPVNFNFAHILSRLNITVKKAASTPDITLTELSIKNLKIQSDFNSSETELASRWATVASGTVEAEYKNYDVTNYEITTNANYILECLLIPQAAAYENVALDGTVTTVTPADTEGGTPTTTTSPISSATAPYIHIQYKIDNETFDAYYNLAALFGADGTTGKTSATFSEAYQNTLNITISPVGIEFSTSGCAWTSQTHIDVPTL